MTKPRAEAEVTAARYEMFLAATALLNTLRDVAIEFRDAIRREVETKQRRP